MYTFLKKETCKGNDHLQTIPILEILDSWTATLSVIFLKEDHPIIIRVKSDLYQSDVLG